MVKRKLLSLLRGQAGVALLLDKGVVGVVALRYFVAQIT